MRYAYFVLGIGFLVILGALYFFVPRYTEDMFMLSSSAFSENTSIPSLYTCDGNNVSPPLSISGTPTGTKSFALVMNDPDVPKGRVPNDVFDHWIVFNIPPDTTEFKEGEVPRGIEGTNTAGKTSYTGPCPPDREHRYFFKLYALDATLNLPEDATASEVEQAMEGHILGRAELMGRYSRTR